MTLPALLPTDLPSAELEMLEDLYRRGTPENTVRAWERDLAYLAAWKQAAFGARLEWPEAEAVALRFILDHSADLTEAIGSPREAAEALIAAGLRRALTCPAPSTLDRRIASWRAFHRMRNLPSPFEAPLIRQARAKARKAAARPRKPKSQRPITREVLLNLLETCDNSLRGIRDRAILTLGFASGGRRRSELTALNFDDIARDEDDPALLWLTLLETKTTGKDLAPRLPVKGMAASALLHWCEECGFDTGPLFRPISRADRPLKRRMSPAGIATILKHRLKCAGLPEDFASPHGLRAGFLTQAALDGAPLAAAMQLSLHKSPIQAQSYYADVEIKENPATELLSAGTAKRRSE